MAAGGAGKYTVRSRSWTRGMIGLGVSDIAVIAVCATKHVRDYGAATSEGLIVRSIHRR